MWDYQNPVRIDFGPGVFDQVPAMIAGRRYAIVTYPDPPFPVLCERLTAVAGPPASIIDDVAPNPDFVRLNRQAAELNSASYDVIVALGGGSVIDTAKVLAAADGDFSVVRRFVETKTGDRNFTARPIIAIPTTAGTGSEVTCWATLWDEEAQRKHSLAHTSLYPERAVVDPDLMRAKPRGLTVATGLDALSHALESIWNINANAVSAHFAVGAARQIIEILPRLAEDLDNPGLREDMARAAVFAGLAFSNTKTALAHSISYPITLRHGVPHGIACSFTLPQILLSVASRGDQCAKALAEIFGDDLVSASDRLAGFLDRLGVSSDPSCHGVDTSEWHNIVEDAFVGDRGKNFIGEKAEFLAACKSMGL